MVWWLIELTSTRQTVVNHNSPLCFQFGVRTGLAFVLMFPNDASKAHGLLELFDPRTFIQVTNIPHQKGLKTWSLSPSFLLTVHNIPSLFSLITNQGFWWCGTISCKSTVSLIMDLQEMQVWQGEEPRSFTQQNRKKKDYNQQKLARTCRSHGEV